MERRWKISRFSWPNLTDSVQMCVTTTLGKILGTDLWPCYPEVHAVVFQWSKVDLTCCWVGLHLVQGVSMIQLSKLLSLTVHSVENWGTVQCRGLFFHCKRWSLCDKGLACHNSSVGQGWTCSILQFHVIDMWPTGCDVDLLMLPWNVHCDWSGVVHPTLDIVLYHIDSENRLVFSTK